MKVCQGPLNVPSKHLKKITNQNFVQKTAGAHSCQILVLKRPKKYMQRETTSDLRNRGSENTGFTSFPPRLTPDSTINGCPSKTWALQHTNIRNWTFKHEDSCFHFNLSCEKTCTQYYSPSDGNQISQTLWTSTWLWPCSSNSLGNYLESCG